MYTRQGGFRVASVISFRIDDEDREALQAYADQFDSTLSWAARRAIKDFVAKLAKESETNENGDNLLFESNGIDGKVGLCTSGDDT